MELCIRVPPVARGSNTSTRQPAATVGDEQGAWPEESRSEFDVGDVENPIWYYIYEKIDDFQAVLSGRVLERAHVYSVSVVNTRADG